MNKVEFTEQTIYEEIYDDFLKELEKTLDIELSNKVKEKNNKLFQVLSSFS
jgi:ribosome-binding protein aMBF1 (putative translation factor)